MLHNTGYGPSFRRRGSGSMLTRAFMTVLGAALAAGLLLAFYNPASGVPGISLPGSGAVPAPGSQSAPLAGGGQAIATKIKPGLVIINTTLQYNSEAAAGTGMVINRPRAATAVGVASSGSGALVAVCFDEAFDKLVDIARLG